MKKQFNKPVLVEETSLAELTLMSATSGSLQCQGDC